ncbi:hypothetical protein AUJ95_00975 [Candidatus Desantisbacteria bacterium CG2_30_40_21]|uniref:DUF502 domain-containing protein n=5 Tax=unclassified Candidatus Desantisiibacteriota TaxID=3106372 RepID=A0A2M7J9G1_9BACT|nr:MAG: hypothetical protein AUJ95_00975 [Candidatus Desantisbacteria bacterium CG2_30_40_21]PIP39699.1 MAG: hypothetical protein COX18_09185 [Candidatus Desantisbacteria bacterium CG23_combo_of_CG06-09_8_20_14_all_40_23]PIX16001.1 MAG: hypothetical protein COZ71_08765 [Candidatus Desantisbacteria bacterium CG_4_8_14_3_um_filter_40_12]PIY19029.1 MAG: hypothetical protein COZ13_07410 [Candidatus Desantisbacteria bacterium CG_4_10_14_3_um_filter_40_18]PJB29514.1 MAG: hypothetical protein CO110_05
MKKILWRTHLRAYLVTGFLTILPVMATAFLAMIVAKLLYKLLGSPFLFLLETFFHTKISGIWLILFDTLGVVCGLICVLVFLTLIGILTANILGRTLFIWFENLLVKVPLISNFYGAIKQLVNILFSNGKSSFTRAVLVEYPRKGVYSIGFVTAEDNPFIATITGEKMVNIYLPTALNIASGFMIVAPAKEIIPLDISVEDGLKLVISGGIISPAIDNGEEKKDDE